MGAYEDSISKLLATGVITKAAILDTSGKPIATSPGYNVIWEEGAQLANGFDLVDGMKGFDFFLAGEPYFIDSVLSETKLIGHRKDASIDREITNKANLAITNERALFGHANHIILIAEFDNSKLKEANVIVDGFLKKPPRA
ncbi:hypothetical protein PLICRDRAFT_39801 [Plicaturopsis crispa FD-325 SS-3]|nr:hypothetical protein PLICRDRAFT_39801 [Plicaturopsis crispa FD-325 SS-3]